MTVEISGYSLQRGIVTIYAIDLERANEYYINRFRPDEIGETEIMFVFDTKRKKDFQNFNEWLHQQSQTDGSRTYGSALNAILGTITDIPEKFRSWD